MFSYDPPLLWLSAEEIPARVEIHKGTMYRFACPYPVYSLRIPDSLRTTVINGTVTDLETQDPLVGTIVTLRTVGSTEARTTTANLAGKFEMRGVPSGSYTLHASALGHESQSYGPFSVGADSSYRMRHIFRLR
jgi:hypothetical protein